LVLQGYKAQQAQQEAQLEQLVHLDWLAQAAHLERPEAQVAPLVLLG
jgi:hypothetical protein